MASPKPKVCAAIYVLDKSLKEHAIKVEKFIKDKCEVQICNCPWDKICPDDKGSVSVTCEHYFNCEEKQEKSFPAIESSHDQCEVNVYDFDDLSETIDKTNSGADTPHYEVIIILGHCSALLAGEDDLVVALRKINPVIVAFLGCCGGNIRYGPIVKMSQLLDPDDDIKGTKPIIGFYQRRVYVFELLSTSLVIGLRYYMHMRNSSLQPAENKANYRKIAICAFGLSTSKIKVTPEQMPLPLYHMHPPHTHIITYSDDPTSFVNDTPENSFVHKCHKKCDLNITDIPLSCMQFALCSPMIMERSLLGKSHTDLSKLHTQIKESNCKRLTKLVEKIKPKEPTKYEKMPKEPTKYEKMPKERTKTKDELDNLCKEENGYQFHKLIPLIYEINFIKLSNETLNLIKKGNPKSWEKIDHLQFLIAVLRGHWGTNSLAVIKAWATFHLMEMMKNPLLQCDHEQQLHKYKLCCMCYVLLSDDHFVRLVEKEHQYKQCYILAYTIIVPDKYMSYSIKDITPETEGSHMLHLMHAHIRGKFPDDIVLSWVDLYQYCAYDNHFVGLSNNPHHIGNRTAQGDMNNYEYNQTDFKLAAGALSDYVKTDDIHRAIVNNPTARICSETCRPISYSCKNFTNRNVEDRYMKCIDEDRFQREFDCTRELSFVESKVIYRRNSHNITDQQLIQCYQQDPATADIAQNQLPAAFNRMSANWEAVSSCRFLFVKFNNPADNKRIEGILFYTDTHYGHNLINFSDPQVLAEACPRCTRRLEPIQADLINTIMRLCMACKYRMQRVIIQQMETGQRDIDFPFAKIGKLILTYDGGHLTDIALEDLL